MVDINNYNNVVVEVFTEDMDINNKGMVWDDEYSYNTGFIFASLKSIPLRSQTLMNPILSADTGSIDNTTGNMLDAFNICKHKGLPTKMVTNVNMGIKSVFDFKGMIIDWYRHKQKVVVFGNFKYILNDPNTGSARQVFIKRMECGRK